MGSLPAGSILNGKGVATGGAGGSGGGGGSSSGVGSVDGPINSSSNGAGLLGRNFNFSGLGIIDAGGLNPFESISLGNDSLGLGFSPGEISQLTQLYNSGKAGLNPDPITLGGTPWYYFPEEDPTRSYGDAYTANGLNYIYLGSGVGEGGVAHNPEFPVASVPVMVIFLGAGYFYIRKRKLQRA
jgi:hypothetical protein